MGVSLEITRDKDSNVYNNYWGNTNITLLENISYHDLITIIVGLQARQIPAACISIAYSTNSASNGYNKTCDSYVCVLGSLIFIAYFFKQKLARNKAKHHS